MTVTIRVPKLRSLALVLLGAVLGATLIAPVSARVNGPTAVEPAAVQTRMVSCAGSGFYPHADVAYDTAGTVRESEEHTTLRCAVALPHSAVVSRVRFTLYDGSISGVVGPCSLKRVGLTPATATTEQTLASVPATDLNDFSGVRRLSDTSISFASVDNARYAYWLECPVNSSPFQGIIGADVTFTISSANG
jgi:hypothetical protein